MINLEPINTGSSPNSNDGDSLRTAFQKINSNFMELSFNTHAAVTTAPPATSKGSFDDEPGTIAVDDTYLYVCVAPFNDDDTDIWKRIPLSVDTW